MDERKASIDVRAGVLKGRRNKRENTANNSAFYFRFKSLLIKNVGVFIHIYLFILLFARLFIYLLIYSSDHTHAAHSYIRPPTMGLARARARGVRKPMGARHLCWESISMSAQLSFPSLKITYSRSDFSERALNVPLTIKMSI